MALKIREDVKIEDAAISRGRGHASEALIFYRAASIGQSVHFADRREANNLLAIWHSQRKRGGRADIRFSIRKVDATDPDGIGYRVFVVAA